MLKQHALSIFEIKDILGDEFLDEESRNASKRLGELRKKNEFLFASEQELPGTKRAERYFRSRCIARVSYFIYCCTTVQ